MNIVSENFAIYTPIFNFTGLPAIQVPYGFDSDGLPVEFADCRQALRLSHDLPGCLCLRVGDHLAHTASEAVIGEPTGASQPRDSPVALG